MKKKILCIIVLVLTLICVLASCGHEHKWSEWQSSKAATCTQDGINIRVCDDCGESQSIPVSAIGHTWSAWNVTKESNCTQDGSRERTCFCGEKETATVYSTGHTNPSPWGCYDCMEGWVTIDLPETPLIVYYMNSAFKITELRYDLSRYDSGYTFKLLYSGEKTIGNSNSGLIFDMKIVDSEGYVISSHSTVTKSLAAGDKLKDSEELVFYVKLDPSKTYTLTISSH